MPRTPLLGIPLNRGNGAAPTAGGRRKYGATVSQHHKKAGSFPSRRLSPSLLPLLFVLREVVFVLSDVALHLLGNLVLGVNGLHRALGLAGPAIDTLFGVDKELVPAVVDAVHRADLHAGLVLRADARLGDYVGHMDPPSRMPCSFITLYSCLPGMSRGR